MMARRKSGHHRPTSDTGTAPTAHASVWPLGTTGSIVAAVRVSAVR
jgi:hypothetical protein